MTTTTPTPTRSAAQTKADLKAYRQKHARQQLQLCKKIEAAKESHWANTRPPARGYHTRHDWQTAGFAQRTPEIPEANGRKIIWPMRVLECRRCRLQTLVYWTRKQPNYRAQTHPEPCGTVHRLSPEVTDQSDQTPGPGGIAQCGYHQDWQRSHAKRRQITIEEPYISHLEGEYPGGTLRVNCPDCLAASQRKTA